MKKTLKITGIIIGIIILIVGLYFLWQSFIAEEVDDTLENNGEETSEFPEIEERSPISTTLSEGEEVVDVDQPNVILSKVSSEDSSAFYFWVKNNNEVLYITNEGNVMKADQNEDEAISNQTINALNNTEASPSGELLLASFGNPLNPDWALFNPEDSTWQSLPNNIVTATWGNSEGEIYAIEEEGNQRNLIRLNSGNIENIQLSSTLETNFVLRDIILKFISPNLYVMEKPSANYSGSIWSYNINTRSFTRATETSHGLLAEWSQDNNLVFRFSSPDLLRIETQDFSETVTSDIDSMPNKCNGLDNLIYCFTSSSLLPPQDSSNLSNVIMPDDYIKKNIFTVDDLMVYDTKTGSIENPFMSAVERIPAIDATNVRYLNDSLYFINRYDRGIYRLTLQEELRPGYEPPEGENNDLEESETETEE